MPYVTDFSALTTGHWRWNVDEQVGTPTVVTYAFVDADDVAGFSENPPFNLSSGDSYQPMNNSQQVAVRDALSIYENSSGLRFVEVSDPSQASIVFVANHAAHLTSWAFFPETSAHDDDVYLGDSHTMITYDPTQSWTTDWTRGTPVFTVILHEIGHAVGLEHPHEGILLDPSIDNHDFTIMSYNWSWSGGSTGRTRDSLAVLDIQAIRYLYGDSAGYTATWNAAGQYLLIDGAAGDDAIVTGRANSLMLGGAGHDRLTGAQFNDTLRGGDGEDLLDGGAGHDRLEGQYGSDKLIGGGGNDLLDGGRYADSLAGESGNDSLRGGLGDDLLHGGIGDDLLEAQDGDDLLLGRYGRDRLIGGAGLDSLNGGGGDDRLFGESADDLLVGEGGEDHLAGGAGDDVLIGGLGADVLVGNSQFDLLSGGAGADELLGGDGNDTLKGGGGNDMLSGGYGADVFVFDGSIGRDEIRDWQDGFDRISFEDRVGFDRFGDIAAASVQRGANVVITLGAGSIVVLHDTQLAELNAGDFIF